ncbi:unnamed protein product, partial [Callosobruchus maculatus]
DEDFTTSSEIVPIDLLEAKDSLIRHEISLLKKREQWRVEPKDSLEVQKDSQAELLQKKSSKLSSAKNSVELMRESKQKLRELTPYPLKICKGERDKNDKRSVTSWPPKEPYCVRCGLRAVSSMDSAMSRTSRTCRSPKDPLTAERSRIRGTAPANRVPPSSN